VSAFLDLTRKPGKKRQAVKIRLNDASTVKHGALLQSSLSFILGGKWGAIMILMIVFYIRIIKN